MDLELYGDLREPTVANICEAAAVLVRKARIRGITLGCAESCTGGLVSGVITSVSGSSEVFVGCIVSYALAIKHKVLGVSQEVLETPGVGAVSSQCALQMAKGARRVLCCDVAVSVTGIAGPGGGEPGKPVGTVWFSVVGPSVCRCVCYQFSGERHSVRAKATSVAISLLDRACSDADRSSVLTGA